MFPPSEAPEATIVRRPAKKQRHAGGAWRAYVRRRGLGSKGRPDLRALARGFNTAKEEGAEIIGEVELAGGVAKAASKLRRASSGQGHFGPKTRDLERKRWEVTTRQVHAACKGLTPCLMAETLLKQEGCQGDLARALLEEGREGKGTGCSHRESQPAGLGRLALGVST